MLSRLRYSAFVLLVYCEGAHEFSALCACLINELGLLVAFHKIFAYNRWESEKLYVAVLQWLLRFCTFIRLVYVGFDL
jgi:hypothetical protein